MHNQNNMNTDNTDRLHSPIIDNILAKSLVANPKYNPKAKVTKNKAPEPKYMQRETAPTLEDSPWFSYNKRATALEFTANDLGVSEEQFKKEAERGVIRNPYTTEEEINKALADRQSGFEQLQNFVVQSVGNEFVLGTLLGLSNIVDMAANLFTAKGEDDYTNPVSKALEDAQDYLREKFKIYRENPNDSFSLSDSGWWFDNAVNIFSTLSMLVPSGMIMKGASLLGKAGRLAAKGTKVEKLMHATKGGMYRTLGKLANTDSTWKQGRMFNAMKGFGEISAHAALSRTMENYMEAREVYKESYENALNNIKSMSDEERQKFISRNPQFVNEDGSVKDDDYIANYIASIGADETFVNDYAMLAFDYMQLRAIGSLWKGVVNKETTAAMRIAARNEAKQLAGKELEKTGFLARRIEAVRYGVKHPFTSPLFAELNEGVEEAYQGIQTEKGKEIAKMQYTPNFTRRSFESYMTDSSIWEQAFWGWMGGIGFQAFGSGVGNIKSKIHNAILENKHNNKKISDIEYELQKLTSDKIRLENIKGYSRLTQEYADVMRMLSGDNPVNPNKIKRNDKGEPILDENGQTQYEEISKEEAALMKENATNKFIDAIGMRAMEIGNFETLRAYLEDENVNEYFINNGLMDRNGNAINQAVIDRLDSVYSFYKQALEDVFSNNDVDDDKIGAARAFARKIAMNKLDAKTMKEALDKLYTDILANDTNGLLTEDVKRSKLKDFVEDRLNNIERRKQALNNRFARHTISKEGYDFEMKNLEEEQMTILKYAQDRLGIVHDYIDNNLNAFLMEVYDYFGTNSFVNGTVSAAIDEQYDTYLAQDSIIYEIENDIPTTREEFTSQYKEYADSLDKYSEERCANAVSTVMDYIKGHANLNQAFNNLFTGEFTDEELEKNPNLKEALEVLRIGSSSTVNYLLNIKKLVDDIIKERADVANEESRITVDGEEKNNDGRAAEHLSNNISDEDKQLVEDYINRATPDQIQFIINNNIPDEFKDKEDAVFAYLRQLAIDKDNKARNPYNVLSDSVKKSIEYLVNERTDIKDNVNMLQALADKKTNIADKENNPEVKQAMIDYASELAKKRLEEINKQNNTTTSATNGTPSDTNTSTGQPQEDRLTASQKQINEYLERVTTSVLDDIISGDIDLTTDSRFEDLEESDRNYLSQQAYAEYRKRLNMTTDITEDNSTDELTSAEKLSINKYYLKYIRNDYNEVERVILRGRKHFSGKKADAANEYLRKLVEKEWYVIQKEKEFLKNTDTGVKELSREFGINFIDRAVSEEEQKEYDALHKKFKDITNKLLEQEEKELDKFKEDFIQKYGSAIDENGVPFDEYIEGINNIKSVYKQIFAELDNEYHNKLEELAYKYKTTEEEKQILNEIWELEDQLKALQQEVHLDDDEKKLEAKIEELKNKLEENYNNSEAARIDRENEEKAQQVEDIFQKRQASKEYNIAIATFDSQIYNQLSLEEKYNYLKALERINDIEEIEEDKRFKVGDNITITENGYTSTGRITYIDDNGACYVELLDDKGNYTINTILYPDASHIFNGIIPNIYSNKVTNNNRLGEAIKYEGSIEEEIIEETDTSLPMDDEQKPIINNDEIHDDDLVDDTVDNVVDDTSDAIPTDDMGYVDEDKEAERSFTGEEIFDINEGFDDFDMQNEEYQNVVADQAQYFNEAESDPFEEAVKDVWTYFLDFPESKRHLLTELATAIDINSQAYLNLENEVIDYLITQKNVPESLSKETLKHIAAKGIKMGLDILRNSSLNNTATGDNLAKTYARIITAIATKYDVRNSITKKISDEELNKFIEDLFNTYVNDRNIDSNKNGKYVIDIIEFFRYITDYFNKQEANNPNTVGYETIKYLMFNIRDYVARSTMNDKFIFKNRRYLNNATKNANDFLLPILEIVYANNRSEEISETMHIAPSNITEDFNTIFSDIRKGDELVLEAGKHGSISVRLKKNNKEIGFLAEVRKNNTNDSYTNTGYGFNITVSKNGNTYIFDTPYANNATLEDFFINIINQTNVDFQYIYSVVKNYYLNSLNKDGYNVNVPINHTAFLNNIEIQKLLGIASGRTLNNNAKVGFVLPQNMIFKTSNGQYVIQNDVAAANYILRMLSNILFYNNPVNNTEMLNYFNEYKRKVFTNYEQTYEIQYKLANNEHVVGKVDFASNYIPKRLPYGQSRDIVDTELGFTHQTNHMVFFMEGDTVIDEAANNTRTVLPNTLHQPIGSMGILLDANAEENSVAPAIAMITGANGIEQNPNGISPKAIRKEDVINEIMEIIKYYQTSTDNNRFDKTYKMLSDLMGGYDSASRDSITDYIFAGYHVTKTNNYIFISEYKTNKCILTIYRYRSNLDKTKGNIPGTGISYTPGGDKNGRKSDIGYNESLAREVATELVNGMKFNRTFYTARNMANDTDTSNSRNHAMYKENGKFVINLGGRVIEYDNFTHFAFANNAFRTNQGGSVKDGLRKVDGAKQIYIDTKSYKFDATQEANNTPKAILSKASYRVSVKTKDVLKACGFDDNFIDFLLGNNNNNVELIPEVIYVQETLKANSKYSKGKISLSRSYVNKGINRNDLLRNIIHEKLHHHIDNNKLFNNNDKFVNDILETYEQFKTAVENDTTISENKKIELKKLIETLDKAYGSKPNILAEEWLVESLTQIGLIEYLNKTEYKGSGNTDFKNNASQKKSLWQKIVDVLLSLFKIANINDNTIFARQYYILATFNETVTTDNTSSPVEEQSTTTTDQSKSANIKDNIDNVAPIEEEPIDNNEEQPIIPVEEKIPEDTEEKIPEDNNEELTDDINLFGNDLYGNNEYTEDYEEDEKDYNNDSSDPSLFSITETISTEEAMISAYSTDTGHNPNGLMNISNMNDFINMFPIAERANIAQMVASNNAKYACL